MKRQRDDGLRKICVCSQREWSACDHPWYFSYKAKGKPRVRVSLDRHAGKHVEKLEDAKALAVTLRGAVNAGTYPPPPTQTAAPIETVTFQSAASRFLESVPIQRGKNQGKPRGTNDAHLVGRLTAWTPPGASAPLGQHAAGSVTEDVYQALHGAPTAAGAGNVHRQQLHPVDQGAGSMAGEERIPGCARRAGRRGRPQTREGHSAQSSARTRHDRRPRQGDTGGRTAPAPEGC